MISDVFLGAEQVILRELGERAAQMDMLDIGAGGGRTTKHFAHHFKSYIGTDYSEAMVNACRAKFGDKLPFQRVDARDMSVFADNSFDFLLFSWGGIDMLSHDDRLKVFSEVKRIARSGALFAFSAHNLHQADVGFKSNGTPLRDIARLLAKTVLNLGFYLGRPKDHVVLRDGYHRFGLLTYYTSPAYQVQQLEAAGFRNIRLLRQQDGLEMSPANCPCVQPTYLCEAP